MKHQPGLGHNRGARGTVLDLPIPTDVRPGPGWSDLMLDMADHIGAYAVLRVVERFGGEQLYIPIDPATNKLAAVIGDKAAAMISHVYGRETLQIPTAKAALARARRGRILAQVRAGELTGADAARILGTSRRYLAQLVNETDEGGESGEPAARRAPDPRQMRLFDES